MIWTVPNILTMGRIAAAPCVALVFVIFDRPLADWLALGLFVGAAITDFFDGWLARRMDQVSPLGKMLDPIADKLIVVIALMVIVWGKPYALPDGAMRLDVADAPLMIAATLIVFREIFVSGLREYLGDVKLAVTKLAKWKATVQMVAIAILLAVRPYASTIPLPNRYTEYSGAFAPVQTMETVGIGLLWLAAVLTLVTGWDYFAKGLAYILAREDK